MNKMHRSGAMGMSRRALGGLNPVIASRNTCYVPIGSIAMCPIGCK